MKTKTTVRILFLTLFMSTSLLAATTGRISGVVRDSDSNSTVEGATVTATTQGGPDQVALTGADGRFDFANLAPGTYLVQTDFAGATDKKTVTVEADKSVEIALTIQESKAVGETYNITVTGSLLGATARDTPIPLLAIDEIDLKKRGAPTVLEQIKELPITGQILGETNQYNTVAQFRPGMGTINLRGLGPQRTLVLLNGKRFSANTFNFADTNMLPAAAIGRVEILKDGGAATYGSDAIAGVANYITKKDFSGLFVNADYRLVPGSIGDVTASATWGWVGNSSNVMLSAGYQMRGELSTNDRDWAVQDYLVNPSGYSVLGNPGAWTILAGATPVGFAIDANCAALGGTPNFTGSTPACYYNYITFVNLVDPTHQMQLYGEANTKLGSTSKLHVEALYGLTVTDASTSPGFPPIAGPNGPGSVNVYSVPANNPGFNTFLTQTGNSALIGVASGARATLWRPVANGGFPGMKENGARINYSKPQQARISADLSGDVGILDMGYQLGATYLIESQAFQPSDILINRLQRALNGLGGPNCTGSTPGANGCQWFNPFSNAMEENPSLGLQNPGFVAANATNTPELMNWMNEVQKLELRADQAVFDGLLDGAVPLKLWGGEPTWALGAQYRKTNFLRYIGTDNSDSRVVPCPTPGDTTCAAKTGPFIFGGQSKPVYLDQNVYALFGQLDIPLFESLKSSFSLRFEDYGGLTGSTLNPQFRTKWQIFDALALRGSIGTSFRGPTANDVSPTSITNLAGIAAAGNSFKAVDIAGNPNLLPEKAFTFNVGSILQFNNFTATVDYWFYSLDNQIVSLPPNLIATAVAGVGNGAQLANCSSPFASLITFSTPNGLCDPGVSTGGSISRVRAGYVNGPNIKTTGIDFELDYLWKHLLGGDLNLGGVASFVISYDQAQFDYLGGTLAPAYSAVGFTNYDRLPGTMPRWRGQFFANYNHGWHNVRFSATYIDGVVDNRGPTVVQTGASTNCNVANATAGTATNCQLTTFGNELKGFLQLDLSYRLSLPWDFTIAASLQNMLNQNPPAARLEYSYDPSVGNPLGINFKMGIEKKF